MAELSPNGPLEPLMLPAPTASDRLAEWVERGEEFVRRRPVLALTIAGVAGVIAGRLFRQWMRSRDVDLD